MKHKKITLPNGLRIITIPSKSPAVTVMALVETGSNYEEKRENGLSHFLEHMVFKGTKKRPSSLHISRELDGLGAQSNAFTSNEVTGYWAKAETKHWKKLTEIISDMYLNPTLPKEELDKERGVILQEISMYEDLPQRKVWEVFAELVYGDVPAGRTILGPARNIRNFSREEFESYRKKHYVAGKTIVVVSGDVKHSDVVREIKQNFKDVSKGKKVGKDRVLVTQSKPKVRVLNKKTDQTHLILGLPTFSAKDKRLPTLEVLSAVLGKSMSSRLFQKLREEMGVCYYVRTGTEAYTDHGTFTISSGVDKNRVEEVLRAMTHELKRLKEELVSEAELKKTKDYMIGHLYMGLETTDTLAEFYLDQEISKGKIANPKDVEREIKKVTAKDLQKLALEILRSDKLNLALVGEVKNSSRLEKLLVI